MRLPASHGCFATDLNHMDRVSGKGPSLAECFDWKAPMMLIGDADHSRRFWSMPF